MPKIITALRYEAETKTIRSVPENYWVASMNSWDGAVDHEGTANHIVAAVNAHNPDRIAYMEFMLAESLTAWEGEEESVKEEHADLIAELQDFANGLPVFDHRDDMVDALAQAESFIAGFEGDELQEGIPELLAGLRAAIKADQARGAALLSAEACLANTLKARGYKPGECTDTWSPEVRLEVRTLASLRATIAAMEGR